jgi:hypothetical protein
LWREVMKRQQVGGLSIRAFCRRERLKESAFYYWRRELARRDEEGLTKRHRPRQRLRSGGADRPAGKQSPVKRTRARFLPVRLAQRPATIGVELALPSGAVLRMPPEAAADEVARVVAAVEGQLC